MFDSNLNQQAYKLYAQKIQLIYYVKGFKEH